MKNFFLTLVVLLTSLVGANAMSYEQARDQALFLTDKMAYELNLNEQQYEAAYEINLDYLMGVTTVDDVYANSWRQRNLDMQYILLDWQFSAFCAATYFYRPLYWNAGCWHFGIYAHYPHRDFFYYSRPVCYVSYRGGHSWRFNGGRSWYETRVITYRGSSNMHHGMREVHGIAVDRSYRSGSNRGSAYRGTGNVSEHRGGSSYRGNVTERRGNSFSGNRGTGSNVRENGSGVGRRDNAASNNNRDNSSSSYNRGNRDNTTSYNRGNRDNATSYNRDNSTSYNRGNRDNSSTSSFSRGSSTRTTVDRQANNSFGGSRESSFTGNRSTSVSSGSRSSFGSGTSSSFGGGTSVSHGSSGMSRGGSSFSRGGSSSHGGGAGVSHGGGFSGGGHGGRR